jgi:hypothetical protein
VGIKDGIIVLLGEIDESATTRSMLPARSSLRASSMCISITMRRCFGIKH